MDFGDFIIFGCLAIIITMLFVGIAASQPLVQFSWESQQCVKVVYGEGSCIDLPAKYDIEWVK